MNIAEINTVNYGSTGKIMLGIQKIGLEKGLSITSYYAIGDSDKNNFFSKKIGTNWENSVSSKLAHVTGMMGYFSVFSTLKLIAELQRNNIELIHLHNIHISFLNYPLFFRYIKKNDISVVWTLHDCWTFTGHCPHFTYPKCDKWKKGCNNCPRYREYPVSTIDNSRFMYRTKKRLFTGINNLTLVTPSKWLESLVKKSFLKEYPVQVINNGIDTGLFRPIASDFRDKNGLNNKFLILGVAFDWGDKKGLDIFIEIARRLEKELFQIVLVGTNEKIDQILPSNIISIHKTNNVKELAELYSTADIFMNPTREEVFGLVNIEANACGTPVLMFDTGGSPECINEKTGVIIPVDDIDELECQIRRLASKNIFSARDCMEQAGKFDVTKKYEEYISLYQKVLEKKENGKNHII